MEIAVMEKVCTAEEYLERERHLLLRFCQKAQNVLIEMLKNLPFQLPLKKIYQRVNFEDIDE